MSFGRTVMPKSYRVWKDTDLVTIKDTLMLKLELIVAVYVVYTI